MGSPLKQGVRDMAVTLGARGGVFVCGVALQSALARLLEPDGRGSFTACVLYGSALAVIFLCGLDTAVQYHVSAGRVPAGQGAWTLLAVGLVGGLLGAALALAGTYSGLRFFDKAPRSAFAVASLWVPFQIWATSLLMAVSALRGFTAQAMLAVGMTVIRLVLTLLLCGAIKLGVHGALWANIAASALVALGACLWMRRHHPDGWTRPGGPELRGLFSYGFRAYFSSLSNLANAQIGFLLLAFFVAEGELGKFSAAAAMILTITMVSDSLSTVLQPRIAAAADGRPELTAACARSAGVLALVVVGGVAVFAEPIVRLLLSDSFLDSVPMVRVIAIGAVVRTASKVLVPYLNGTDRPEIVAIATVVGTVVNAAALLLLLPRIGLVGAAWSMSLGYIANAAIILWGFHAFSRMTVYSAWLPRRSDAQMLREAILSVAGRGRVAVTPVADGEQTG
ncbi:MAG: hypothetical protein C4547_09165 [Phycisphaerales bacterium]|nr:MAG: hypothetical protein C4547_09165 [Phycisphaerales bacterium]